MSAFKKVIDEVYDNERYIRINDNYENDIIGTWEGKVTSSEDEHTDGETFSGSISYSMFSGRNYTETIHFGGETPITTNCFDT